MTISAVSPYLDYFLIIAIVSGFIASYFLLSFVARLRRLRLIAAMGKLLSLILFSAVTGFTSLILISTRGYQALTFEQSAALIHIIPQSPQMFVAEITLSDGRIERYLLKGDEIMIEANILKWKSWANMLGLNTAFRLDRVRGRYSNLEDERSRPLSVYSMRGSVKVDLADWRGDYKKFAFLLDVEHGSASYVSAKQEKHLQLMVTSSGLLLREIMPQD
ncbi:MAG: hypothetical protein Q9M92_07600 [Enterobacterales bacterium]|nr:hypothetical protein [Enterobacterales bacterium]